MNYMVSEEGLYRLQTSVAKTAVFQALQIRRPLYDYAREPEVLRFLDGFGYTVKDLHAWKKQGLVTVRRVKNAYCYSMVEVSTLVSNFIKERELRVIPII